MQQLSRSLPLTKSVLSRWHFGSELAHIKLGDCYRGGIHRTVRRGCARLFSAERGIVLELGARRRAFALECGYADRALEPNKAVLERVLSLRRGRVTDTIIEAAGSAASFEQVWRVPRLNSMVVAVVALCESSLSLPSLEMYGKNASSKAAGWMLRIAPAWSISWL